VVIAVDGVRVGGRADGGVAESGRDGR
jgi:hypothetical protein